MLSYRFEDTDKTDELMGGQEQAVSIVNVEVESGTALSRGTILAGNVGGKYAPLTANDTSASMVIVANDAETDAAVVSAYASGKFNREKLIYAEGLDLANFETEMRRQNLILTSLKG